MFRQIPFPAWLLGMFWLAGCSGSRPALPDSKLLGDWRISSPSGCQPFQEGAMEQRVTLHVDQAGRVFPYSATVHVFAAGDCGGTVLMELGYTGRLHVLGEHEIPGAKVREARHSLADYRVIIRELSVLEAANDTSGSGMQKSEGQRFCSKADAWQIDESYDVTDIECTGFNTLSVDAEPDILQVDVDNELIRFGKGELGQDEPFTELDDGTTRVWYRAVAVP